MEVSDLLFHESEGTCCRGDGGDVSSRRDIVTYMRRRWRGASTSEDSTDDGGALMVTFFDVTDRQEPSVLWSAELKKGDAAPIRTSVYWSAEPLPRKPVEGGRGRGGRSAPSQQGAIQSTPGQPPC